MCIIIIIITNLVSSRGPRLKTVCWYTHSRLNMRTQNDHIKMITKNDDRKIITKNDIIKFTTKMITNMIIKRTT